MPAMARHHLALLRLSAAPGKDGHRAARRRLVAPALFLACVLIASCGSSHAPTLSQQADVSGPKTHYPVTIENCGSRIVFDRPPARVATSDIITAEDLIALGLERSVVEAFRILGDEPQTASGAPLQASEPKRFFSALRALPATEREEFNLVSLAAKHPDFLFAGWWNYGLEPGTIKVPQMIERNGVKTLALTESCAQVQPNKHGVNMQDTYRDLSNLGVIFDVQGRASALIAQMKAAVAAVHAKVSKLPPVSVFLYENDTSDPVTALGLGTPTALIEQAGGTNVFASKKRTWTAVRWSEVAAHKPQCIIIDDYATPSWQEKEAFLRNFPAIHHVPAVRNGCIMHLSYDMLAPGPRNAEAVEAIARRLHPQAFS